MGGIYLNIICPHASPTTKIIDVQRRAEVQPVAKMKNKNQSALPSWKTPTPLSSKVQVSARVILRPASRMGNVVQDWLETLSPVLGTPCTRDYIYHHPALE